MCRSAGENGGRRRETAGGMGERQGRIEGEGVKGLQGCVAESWGIDSGPFDMLICLLTALIAPSSHRGLQREDAF